METTHTGIFTDAHDALRYALAGKARIALTSLRTGARYTYRIARAKGDDDSRPWFVSVLSGPDNETDYTYLGTIFADGRYFHGRKSKVGRDATSARAFGWAWPQLSAGTMPVGLQVSHEGRCGRCSRLLTTPESVAAGFGPECIGKVEGM